jgi:hypothetical protein
VIISTATKAPMKDEVKAAVSAAPASLRHRVAVEGGGHRPGLARDVEQDRGDRPAEQRTPVDAAEHDDGRGRRHREGQRQQDGHAVGTAQARQHADEHAQDDADEHQHHVHRAQHDGKALHQRAQITHSEAPAQPARSTSEKTQASGRRGTGFAGPLAAPLGASTESASGGSRQ